MNAMTVPGLLARYKGWVEKGDIQFLQNDTTDQATVLREVRALLDLFKDAEQKDGDYSTNLDWADAHHRGILLWKALMSAALNQIDRESQGQQELFQYVKAATEFEDLLYGLEPYYRDHTLHVLWVYLIGEHILRDHLPEIRTNPNWYVFNDITKDSSEHSPTLVNASREMESRLYKKLGENGDAVWCVTALCHDLGYSLAKLGKLNDKARSVLGFFGLSNFRQIGYTIDIEHQFHIAQFIELMAAEIRLVPHTDNSDVVAKCYRDDSTYWRLCRALERRQHGILSAYLLYKLLGIFADTWTRDTGEQWGLEEQEVVDTAIRGSILFAIAQHEFDFASSEDFGGVAELLILADELEEFSRYGRPMLSRRYHDTMAESSVSFDVEQRGHVKSIGIEVTYSVIREEDLYPFFKRKAERMCQLYALSDLSDDSWRPSRSLRITKLMMRAKHASSESSFCLSADLRDWAWAVLPPSTSDQGKSRPAGKYKATCRDDRILLEYDNELIPLSDWLGIKDDDDAN